MQSTRFSDGRIAFTDRFVQPNFSADLSDLRGTLGAYRSGSPEMAPIELQGVVARTGRLQVNGRLNPTADPLALDVRAQATQVEMPPLSPYAGRYAGYEIDRGKLNLDIHYDVQPDGRLEAQHHLVLDQLAFGRRVESPQATKLPVRLATALLQDKNGVIDLNLPVTGSLQNPDFSVGGVIAKMLGNLLAKAVTSPFSLIAGAQGDMERVEFQSGTDVPTAKGRQTLDRLAKALADRPSLRVTLTGEAATGLESGALHEAMFEQRLHTGPNQKAAERRARSPWGSGPSATESAASAPPLAERERLLRQLYRDTDLPDKPRNFFGIAKDIPVPEMEARLRAQVQPGPDDWRELAADRAMAVRDALVARGLPVERLFTAAPKVHQAEGPSDDDGRAWVPSTSLSLSAN